MRKTMEDLPASLWQILYMFAATPEPKAMILSKNVYQRFIAAACQIRRTRLISATDYEGYMCGGRCRVCIRGPCTFICVRPRGHTKRCFCSRALYEGVVRLFEESHCVSILMAWHITAVLATKSPQPMPRVLLKRPTPPALSALPLSALLLFRPPSESRQTWNHSLFFDRCPAIEDPYGCR